MHSDTGTCAVCGKTFPRAGMRSVGDLTPSIRASIRAEGHQLEPDALICRTDAARFRRRHLEELLQSERGALTRLDKVVLDSLQSGLPVAQEVGTSEDEPRSFGETAADGLARFGGSWAFIIGFAVVLAGWMALNVSGLVFGAFDPYPFILLNLVLSSLAALQAPIIMMSQRRQEEKDRQRSENDYKVNLKAELEIRHLHDKIDLHLSRQWERLAAIQRLQIELLEDSREGRG